MSGQSFSDAHNGDDGRPRLASWVWLAAAALGRMVGTRVRRLAAGTLAMPVVLGIFAVAAIACEGTGGPPTTPPSSETVVPNPGNPGVQACYLGKSVDCASGNETEQQTDISIGGRGPGLRIVRSYNALSAAEAKEPGPWGYGWTGSYDASIEVGSETVTVHQDNGSAVTFYKSGSEYTQGGWVQARLSKSGSDYLYTLPNQTKLEFNSEDRLAKETERNGNSNTLTYNGSHQLEKVEDGDKRTLTFKYNGEGLVESVTDPMKHVVSYTYHEKQLASVTIEGKERWKLEYESPHLLKKVTDGREHATTIKYEATTHRVTEEEIAGHVRKWKYGTSETTITEPNGAETVEVFNSAGEPTKITHAKGAGVETTSEYEYSGETYNVLKFTDGSKHEWKYGYDSEGNKTSETDPNKDERKWTYDKKHDIETETTPEGEKTTYKLDSNGLPEVIERPIGSETQKTEYKYDGKGDLEEEIDPLKHATKYTYDAAGDKETEKDPEGDERKWKYNEGSQVTEETSPRGYTTIITRNEQGWPTKIENQLKHTTEYKYDGNGNIESETDGNSHTTKYEYNEENLRTKMKEPNGDTTETGYDSEGQMTSHTDGNKHAWEYKRNQLEQVTEEKNPLGKVWKKKYDKAGNLESIEDPEKHTTEYSYDESNRPTKIKYSTGKPSEVTYEYNKDGKVTKMKDETGTTENTWDKLDRLTEYKSGAGKIVKYEYNLDNEPTKITYPNKEAVAREYDKNGRLSKVTDWDGNETTFKYNADSELTATIFPSSTKDEDTYEYSHADAMSETKMLHGGTTLQSYVYTRDDDEQLTKTEGAGTSAPESTEYSYDEDSRIANYVQVGRSEHEYKYDDANNLTKGLGGEYTYGAADELEAGPSVTYSYNEDGQRTESKPTGGPTTTYGYDQAGNVTSVKRPEATGKALIEDSFTYDGNNLRQSQTINGTTTSLTWDTAEEVPIMLSDENYSFIYGPENLPFEQVNSVGTISYLHHDQQGSTRLITNASGEAAAGYEYSPYGELRSEWHNGASEASTPLRYDGQYTNVAGFESGLVYLRNRVYDPETAQFLSIDPALESTNEPYTYTKDNPLDHADPTGEGWWPSEWGWWPSANTWRWIGTGASTLGFVASFFGPVGLVVAAGLYGLSAVISGVLAIKEAAAGNGQQALVDLGGVLVGGGGVITTVAIRLGPVVRLLPVVFRGYTIFGVSVPTTRVLAGWFAFGTSIELHGYGVKWLSRLCW
jgi:RHS repeat-associated protein